ncbi:MAG: 1-phosphofructokinase [Candidatus Omnitrophica bacterium]|nr:1-phosphofructokinase [Candidatus Omnitrophota bacterium]
MIVTVTLNPSLDEWVLLPRLRVGELNRAVAFQRYPGGKGINVSRVIHELKARTLAVAFAGGLDGVMLGDLLTRQGIRHQFVTVPGATRNNYQIQTASPKTLSQINCAGPRITASALVRVERLLSTLRPRPSYLVLSGSLPPGAPSHTYQRLIAKVTRLQIPTILDSSGPALRQGMLAAPWLIKPNRQETEELLGRRLRRPSHVAKAAAGLVARGPQLAIISLGAEGAALACRGRPEVWWAKPPTVPVGSTVGAGDSLVAGFVVGYRATRSLEDALRLGVACGAATAMTPGTELCHRKDVDRLLPQVVIKRIP